MGLILDMLQGIPSNPALRERAALADAQYQQSQSEVIRLSKINVALEQKVSLLESELTRCKEELQVKLQIIHSLQNPLPQDKYDYTSKQILKTFFDQGAELAAMDFMGFLPDINTIQYHLDILSRDRLIEVSTFGQQSSWARVNTPDRYSITPEGRKFVIECLRA